MAPVSMRIASRAVAAGVVALVLTTGTCRADTLTFEPAKDNTIFSNGTNSNGAGPVLFSGQTGTPVLQRALLKFNLCDVPRGSTVTSAQLTLHLERAISSGQVHTLHRVVEDWGEGTSSASGGDMGGGGEGAPATTDDATWTHTFFPGSFWSLPGGDFVPGPSASQTVGFNFGGPPAPYTWGSTPTMVADVQLWVNEPSINSGWILLGDEVAVNSAKRFASREAADSLIRPSLRVTFTPPADPCPADCANVLANGVVDVNDLLDLLAGWGKPCQGCDLNCDNTIDVVDLLALLADWGDC